MPATEVLLNRNQVYSETFNGADLKMRPNLMSVIVTCMDPRVDPAHFLNLENGDSVVIRTAGGRVTRGVMNDLAIIGYLGGRQQGLDTAGAVGGQPAKMNLVVIHHTGCGMVFLAESDAQEALAGRLGVTPDDIKAMAIGDPAESVADDVAKLNAVPGLSDKIDISGYVYDVESGALTEVV